MGIIRGYKEQIFEILSKIAAEEESITAAGTVIADAVMDGQVINVVGPGGHSNIPVQEVTYRAGVLVQMNGMLDAGTNLIMGGKRTTCYERLPGYAGAMLDAYGVGHSPDKVLIICNAYGMNSMTIECALEAKKRGLISIGITSESFCRTIPAGHPSRHPSGQSLFDLADIVINSHIPYGDATTHIEGVSAKVGPTSTFGNVFAINCIAMRAAEIMAQRGFDPPVWTSSNLPDGDDLNQKYAELYKGRIRHLW